MVTAEVLQRHFDPRRMGCGVRRVPPTLRALPTTARVEAANLESANLRVANLEDKNSEIAQQELRSRELRTL